MPRPVIGIATQTLEATPGELPDCWIMGQSYVRVLRNVGAIPWLIPLLTDDRETMREIYDRLDGVFLTGGVDVDPSTYGEPKEPYCGHTDRSRDDVIGSALERANPIDRVGVSRRQQDHRHVSVPAPPRLTRAQTTQGLRRSFVT